MIVQLLNLIDPKYDPEIALIADIAQQYSDLVCAAHGLTRVPVMFDPGLKEAPDGTNPLDVIDKATVDGALGFHDRDKFGRPFGQVFRSLVPGGEMLRDKSGHGQSLAGVITHELAEMIADPAANAWRQMRIKDPESRKIYTLACQELCDWVQNAAFALKAKDGTEVDCSDFVFPAFFNPDAQPGEQLSYMRAVTEPGQVAEGGYGIVANESGDDQIFGRMRRVIVRAVPKRIFHATVKPPEWRERMFEHKTSSRTKRRLATNVAA